jgi:ferric-dicitrate binding protein FerR (iron transport regulator)
MDSTNTRPAFAVSRRTLVGGAALCLVPLPALAAPAQAGSVQSVSGEAYAEGGGGRRTLAAGAPVYTRDVVGTGAQSRLALRLGGSTTLRLGSQARVRLDKYIANAGGELTLQDGAVMVDEEGQRGRNISVRSPFALIAVRGTVFFAGPSAGVFGVFAASGSVQVTAAGKRVALTEGMGTNIARPGAPPSDPSAWGTARIEQALASVQ